MMAGLTDGAQVASKASRSAFALRPRLLSAALLASFVIVLAGAANAYAEKPKVKITTPPSNAIYKYNETIDAKYSCTAASGQTLKSCVGTVANGSPIDTTTATSLTFSVTAEDTNNEKTTVKHKYTVEPEAPKATISGPASGGTYKKGESVPTTFSCTEGGLGSGLESCDDSHGTSTVSGGAGTLDTSTLGPHTYTVTAKSKDGLTGTASITYTVAEPPTATISAPAGGGTYKNGESVLTTFSCAEGSSGPGLESCDDSHGTSTVSGGAGTLDTSTLGPHTYTVTAKSKDGLTGTASITYTVVEPPTATIESPATGGTYKAGEVIPTKFKCMEGAFGPGLESCDDNNGTNTVSGGAGTLNIGTVGMHTYTVTAKSKDGFEGTASLVETAINACNGMYGFADGQLGGPISNVYNKLSTEPGAKQVLEVGEKALTDKGLSLVLIENPLTRAECVVAGTGLKFVGGGPASFKGQAGYEALFALDITSPSGGSFEVEVFKSGVPVYSKSTALSEGLEGTF